MFLNLVFPLGYIYYMKKGKFDWIELTPLSKVHLSLCAVISSGHLPCTLDHSSSKAGGGFTVFLSSASCIVPGM